MTEEASTPNVIELATELTIAWLSNPNTRATAEEVPAFLKSMHTAVGELSFSATPPSADEASSPEHVPAVSVRKSLGSKDHIISMIDGKPYKTLRRHLSTHGLTPEQYRERYNLKPDYPMVAPSYSEHRRAMAHKIGLGARGRAAKGGGPQTSGTVAPTPEKVAAPKAKRTPRRKAPSKADASAS